MSSEDDHHMEMVNYNGSTYWVPAQDKNSVAINSFGRWEQAFRVFSNIYSRQYPGRSTELIQYNHVIYTASLSYAWENVYLYDKEFRLHMSRHPERNWSVILQQAWSMYLKDRVHTANEPSTSFQASNTTPGKPKSKRLRYDFNAGNCEYGAQCRFEHRCGVCGKFGHGTFNCRRLKRRSSGGTPGW